MNEKVSDKRLCQLRRTLSEMHGGWIAGLHAKEILQLIDEITEARHHQRHGGKLMEICATCRRVYGRHADEHCDWPPTGRTFTTLTSTASQ